MLKLLGHTTVWLLSQKLAMKIPEVYRFYSISEVRETIGKLGSLRLASGTKPVTGLQNYFEL